MQGAAKVGVLVISFIILIVLAYGILGKSIFAPKTTTYFADFDDVAGVTEGAKVLMAGVKVGTVVEVTLKSPTQARLKMEIESDKKIPEGSTALLASSLIGFGDNPIQIMPPKRVVGGFMRENTVMVGSKATPLSSILPEGQTTIAELNKTLAATRKLLEDEKLKSSIEKLLASSDRTISQFGSLAASTNNLIVQNRASINRAMKEASLAIGDIRKGIALATDLMKDDSLKGKVAGLLDRLNSTSSEAEKLVKSLDEFVNDPKLREPMAGVMSNVKTMTDSGTRIAASTEEMAKNGVTISSKAIELADKANLIADEARETLKKLQGFFQKVPSGNVFNKLETRMDLIREEKPGHFRTDFEVVAPFKDFNVHAGIFDAFETNKLSLQMGQRFGKSNEYRYGVYAGKPGIGVDLLLAPRLHFEGNLFDLNETRLDLRARYDFGKDFVGWFGVNRVFGENSPMIGIGFRK